MYSLGDFFDTAGEQFSELIDVLGPDNIFLSLIIIGFFFLISKVIIKLRWKVFLDDYDEPNMTPINVVSAVISFSIAWLINKSGAVESLHAGDVFDYLGYSSGPAATIIPLLVLIVFIYMMVKIGPLFLILGGLALIGISFTDLIYSKGRGIFLGIVLLLIGILWLVKKSRKDSEGGGSKVFGKSILILLVAGLLVLIPISFSFDLPAMVPIVLIVIVLFLIIIWWKGRNKGGEAGENIPGVGKDWLKKLIPIILVGAVILFLVLSLSSGTSSVGFIILIAIAAIVVIVVLIRLFKKKNVREKFSDWRERRKIEKAGLEPRTEKPSYKEEDVVDVEFERVRPARDLFRKAKTGLGKTKKVWNSVKMRQEEKGKIREERLRKENLERARTKEKEDREKQERRRKKFSGEIARLKDEIKKIDSKIFKLKRLGGPDNKRLIKQKMKLLKKLKKLS